MNQRPPRHRHRRGRRRRRRPRAPRAQRPRRPRRRPRRPRRRAARACTTTPSCARGWAPTRRATWPPTPTPPGPTGFAEALRGATGQEALLASKRQPGRETATAPARCHRAMRRLLTALRSSAWPRPRPPAPRRRDKLLRDACGDEHIDGTYTQAEYKKALDAAADRLRRVHGLPRGAPARAPGRPRRRQAPSANNGGGGVRHGGGGGTGGGSARAGHGSSGSASARRRAPPTRWPAPRPSSARRSPRSASRTKPVDVGGQLVQPGRPRPRRAVGVGRDVPTPLIALICLLAAAALGAGGWWLWSRVLARRFG